MNEQLMIAAFRVALERLVGGFSQAEVARASGVPESTLSRIRSDSRSPNLRTVIRIIRAYPELGRVFAPMFDRDRDRALGATVRNVVGRWGPPANETMPDFLHQVAVELTDGCHEAVAHLVDAIAAILEAEKEATP